MNDDMATATHATHFSSQGVPSAYPSSEANASDNDRKKSSQEASPALMYDDSSEEEQDRPSFSTKQKWQIGSTVLLSFFIFTLLLFPYKQVLRSIFVKVVGAMPLVYESVDLNIFGSSFIDILNYQINPEQSLEARQLQLDIPLLQLTGDSINGSLQILDARLALSLASLSVKQLEITIALDKIKQTQSEWDGTVKLNSQGVKLLNLNIAALESLGIDLSKMNIQKLDLQIAFGGGKLKFNGSQFVSDYFTINLTGFARIRDDLANAMLDAKVCVIPAADLEAKNTELLGAYVFAGGAAGGELCFKLQGKLNKPDFEKVKGTQANPENPESGLAPFKSNVTPATPPNSYQGTPAHPGASSHSRAIPYSKRYSRIKQGLQKN